MGQIPKTQFLYPDIDIEQARKMVSDIAHDFGGKVERSRMQAFAQAEGHTSSNSGMFRQKIASLVRYGLLHGRRDTFELTQLANRLIENPTRQDYENIIGNIPLFQRIREMLNDEVPVELESWTKIINDITGVSVYHRTSVRTHRIYSKLISSMKKASESKDIVSTTNLNEIRKRAERYYYPKLENPNTRLLAIRAICKLLYESKYDSQMIDLVFGLVSKKEIPAPEKPISDFVNALYRTPNIIGEANEKKYAQLLKQQVLDDTRSSPEKAMALELLGRYNVEEFDEEIYNYAWKVFPNVNSVYPIISYFQGSSQANSGYHGKRKEKFLTRFEEDAWQRLANSNDQSEKSALSQLLYNLGAVL